MKVLTFYLCERLFGMDITLIKEINRNVEYTQVPDTSPNIVGLFNMRGHVVTLLDIARIMGYREETCLQKGTCIILKSSTDEINQIGFIIDRAGDVLDVTDEDLELPPANINGISSEYIQGVVKLKEELLIILDPDKVFAV